MTSSRKASLSAAMLCALAGAAVFHFFGNANRGYIDTASLFYWWTFQWWNADSETQHGWLILVLSGWLFWRNLGISDRRFPNAEFNRQSAIGNWHSVAAMLAGLALHVVGYGVQQARISIIALLLFTWGVLRLAGGRRWGSASAFPLAFLVFAIPMNVLDSLGFWLRLGVIDATALMAQAAGIGVLQSGTQLLAPDGSYQYDVAAACSGVRSLMALSALSLLTGYLSFRSWWRRGLLLLLCFPLVYVGNVARIASIVFAADIAGQVWGERVHDIMGYGVFVIVLGGVFGAGRLLEMFAPEKSVAAADVGSAQDADPATQAAGHDRRLASAMVPAVFVAILCAAELALLAWMAGLPPRGRVGVTLASDGLNPVALPGVLAGEWFGRQVEVTDVEREILPPDTGFSRKQYVPLSNPSLAVFLSIVLSGRDRTSIHRPELCLVGQGWTITGTGRQQFRHPATGETFEATLLNVRREIVTPTGTETIPQVVVYWFVAGDAVVPSHWTRAAHDALNRLFRFRADRWAYVLMQTDAQDGEQAAVQRMQTVLNHSLPAFQPPFGNDTGA